MICANVLCSCESCLNCKIPESFVGDGKEVWAAQHSFHLSQFYAVRSICCKTGSDSLSLHSTPLLCPHIFHRNTSSLDTPSYNLAIVKWLVFTRQYRMHWLLLTFQHTSLLTCQWTITLCKLVYPLPSTVQCYWSSQSCEDVICGLLMLLCAVMSVV